MSRSIEIICLSCTLVARFAARECHVCRTVRRTHPRCLHCALRSGALVGSGAASTSGVYARIRSTCARSFSASAVHAAIASRSASRIPLTRRW